MLSSPFRNALRRSTNAGLNVPRAPLWTRAARTPRRYERAWMPVAAGALTLSVGLMVGGVVRLDSTDGAKLKPKAGAKQAVQAEVETKPSEFLQAKEDEAKAETLSEPESEASGEDAGTSSGAGGAFNPETGEINWDCPCLGGMAHGPCGPEFREAFSCFVYSEDEPKGINCVEKFKGMQDCFRRHPEVYGEEIMAEDDDDDDDAGPSGTDSPGLEGELPPVDPVSDSSPGATVSPSS